jgi:hypothetical protein
VSDQRIQQLRGRRVYRSFEEFVNEFYSSARPARLSEAAEFGRQLASRFDAANVDANAEPHCETSIRDRLLEAGKSYRRS